MLGCAYCATVLHYRQLFLVGTLGPARGCPGSTCISPGRMEWYNTLQQFAWSEALQSFLFALQWTIVTMFSTHVTIHHHLISQAGWNRCNLSFYLSIYLSTRKTLIERVERQTMLDGSRGCRYKSVPHEGVSEGVNDHATDKIRHSSRIRRLSEVLAYSVRIPYAYAYGTGIPRKLHTWV